MTSPGEHQPPRVHDSEVEGLFRAARVLLAEGGHLDALPLLHIAMQNALGVAVAGAPRLRYRSQSEAREQHALLVLAWQERTLQRPAAGTLRALWRRRPYWFTSALTGVIISLLALRYAWATHHADWARQHPEGSWISRFYATPDFQGYPLVRYDIAVNYDFGLSGAADSMPKDQFSARWDTCAVVAQEVTLSLRLDSDDSSTLWVDGMPQLAVEPGPGSNSGQVVLRQGVHHLSVDIIEKTGPAMIRLEGLEAEGVDAYHLQRPAIDGMEVRCQ